LNKLKEAEAPRDQAIGLRQLSGSPEDIVLVGVGGIFSILNKLLFLLMVPSPH
jgi:hypothetical protein